MQTLATSVRKTDHGTSTAGKPTTSKSITEMQGSGTGDSYAWRSARKGWHSHGLTNTTAGDLSYRKPIFAGHRGAPSVNGGGL